MLTADPTSRYAPRASAKSLAGIAVSKSNRRNSAPMTGAFFVPVSYGGCAWDTFGYAGFLFDRSANLRTVAPIRCFAATGGDSNQIGVKTMASLRLSNLVTRSLSSRAAAHRAMAKAALFADSSTRTRLKRYNHHIEKAQQLEARALEAATRSTGGAA